MNIIIGEIGSIFFLRNFYAQFSILILYCLFLSKYRVSTIKNIIRGFASYNISAFFLIILILYYIIVLKTTSQILFIIN